jgi:hypothetical protein
MQVGMSMDQGRIKVEITFFQSVVFWATLEEEEE